MRKGLSFRDESYKQALERGHTSTSMNLRVTEKQTMHGLNNRLAGFIEKVHQLESQNEQLAREIEEIKGRAKPASYLEEEYRPELSKLRQLVQEISHQKNQIEIEHQTLEEELRTMRSQHEKEARGRSDAERNISLLKKEVNDAYQAKLLLDKKSHSLVDEIQYLKNKHEEDVAQMFDQIQSAQVSVNAHRFGDPGVTAALRDIREQLEGHTASDLQHVGETFKSQFARLTEAAETKREALRASQQEVQEHRRRLQAKSVELDCAKGTREALEKQMHDVEERHKEELIHYQNAIKELENELISCKFDMSAYLREFQDLLNVKMALDVEILSYRKLVCAEEARLSSVSDAHISLPYIYHQSPVYTLPCFSRPGAPRRRAEPQYKFVEEIITETTREIEMSEFEESGSEEMEGGRGEQEERDKRERGSSEEEEEDGDKDGGEEEGEPVYRSEPDQEDLGDAVDGPRESPGEAEDAKRDEEGKEEVEEAQTDEKERDSEDLPRESQKQEDTEEEKGTESIDVKPEVNGEEQEMEESQKEDAGVDTLKKPGDSSKESDKAKALSGAVKVQDQPHTLAVKSQEKTNKSDNFSDKVPVSPEIEEKKKSQTTPKEIIANSGEKEAKILQDATDVSNEVKEKESSLKADEKSLPEADDKKLNSASHGVPS